VAQKSVNLNYSPVLKGMFRFKPASQYVEGYHSVAGCAFNMEDLIRDIFLNATSNKEMCDVLPRVGGYA
jgi:hypothetical protein